MSPRRCRGAQTAARLDGGDVDALVAAGERGEARRVGRERAGSRGRLDRPGDAHHGRGIETAAQRGGDRGPRAEPAPDGVGEQLSELLRVLGVRPEPELLRGIELPVGARRAGARQRHAEAMPRRQAQDALVERRRPALEAGDEVGRDPELVEPAREAGGGEQGRRRRTRRRRPAAPRSNRGA